jgi:hypothetical protein
VVCAPAACIDGRARPETRCDGSGGCSPPEPADCGAYACERGSCKRACTSRTSALDCAPDATCLDPPGNCIQTALCDDEHTLRAPGDLMIDCSPYKCDPAGACMSECTSTLQCIDGYVCSSNGECVARDLEASSGCACSGAGSASPGAGALLVALLTQLHAWRRRRRRAAELRALPGPAMRSNPRSTGLMR